MSEPATATATETAMAIGGDDQVTPMQTEEPVSKLRAMSKLAKASAANSSKNGATGPSRMAPTRRGVERLNSGSSGRRTGLASTGSSGRRSAPRRTQSHRIGRPAFSADLASQDVPRTVNRSNSSLFTRAAPVRTGSFQRKVPNRSHSSNSLRAKQRAAVAAAAAANNPNASSTETIPDDGDSVFTSASNQTLDSVMLRKRQIKSTDGTAGQQQIVSGVPPAVATLRRDRRNNNNAAHSIASSSFDIDESLHTVDSIPVHMRHLQSYHQDHNNADDQCDLSVFSESFVSTETYMLSDYEEDEDEKFENLREDDEESQDLE